MQKLFTILFAFILLTARSTQAQVTIKTESFDGATFTPTGWVLYPATTASQAVWTRRTGGVAPLGSLTPHSGTGMASYRSSSTGTAIGTQQAMITPAFDLSNRSTNSAGIRFWMFRDSNLLANVDSIEVLINTTADTVNATKIGTVARNRFLNIPDTQYINRWAQYSFSFPASYTGATNYVIIRGTCRGGVRIYVDDVEWDTYPNQCTGTPNVGTITLTTTKICGGAGSSNLGLTAPITGVAGITYQWASASNIAGPFTNFGTNSATAVTGTITATTYYQCTVTCSASGLTYSTPVDSVIVIATPNPTVTATAVTNPVCSNAGNTLVTAVGALTYTWTPAFVSANTNADSVYVAPTTTTNYTIVGTDSNGCKGTGNFTLTVRTAPNATITSNAAANTICAGTTVILTAPFANGITYSWTDGHTTRRDTVAPTTTTVYGVTVTNTTTGCSNTDTITIVVNTGSIPVITISPASATYCVGTPLMLVASGANTYTWSPANGLSSTTNDTVYATPFANTTYTVTGTNGACPGTATVPVLVNTPPVKSAITIVSGNDTVCAGTTIILRGNPTGTGYTYTWNNGVTSRNDTIAPTVSGLYVVTVATAGGCSVNDSISIDVVPGTPPTLSVSPSSATSCSGAAVTLIASATNTTSLTWSPTPASISASGDTAIVAPTGPNNSTVTYVATASNGACSTSVSIPVLISTNPTKQAISFVSGSANACAGSMVIMRGNPFGNGYSYTWSNGATTRNDTVYPTVGTALYYVVVKNAAGCSVSDSVTLNVQPSPIVNITTSRSPDLCPGDTITFTANVVGGTTTNWTRNGFQIPGANTLTYTTTQAGTYNLNANSSNGCVGTDTAVVVVIHQNPILTAMAMPNDTICANAWLTLSASTQGVNDSIYWDNGAVNNTAFPVTASTNYTVNATSAFGCKATPVSIAITALPAPTHGVVVGYSTITFGTACSYYASNPDPNVTIQWIVFGGTINAGQNTDTVNITWNQGPCSLVLVQTNSIGCSDSSEYFVAADGISQLNTIHFNLQPNPSEQKTQIMGVKVARYEVQDLSGRVLLSERNTNEVDGMGLPAGIYLIRIYDAQGRAAGIAKWVKE